MVSDSAQMSIVYFKIENKSRNFIRTKGRHLDNLMDWLVRLEASNNQEDNWADNWADNHADNQADEWVWAN